MQGKIRGGLKCAFRHTAFMVMFDPVVRNESWTATQKLSEVLKEKKQRDGIME